MIDKPSLNCGARALSNLKICIGGRKAFSKISTWRSQKQGVDGAEQAQERDKDYATAAISRDEYVSLAEAAVFEYAFKLGMQIAIETLTK